MNEFLMHIWKYMKVWPSATVLLTGLFAIVVVKYLTILVCMRILSPKPTALRKKYAQFYSYVFSMVLLLCFALADLKFFHQIPTHNSEGALILSVLVLGSLAVYARTNLKTSIKAYTSSEVGLYIGPKTHEKARQNEIANYYRSATFGLLLLLPFLILFITPKHNTLLSIIVDNSTSMKEQMDALVTGLSEISPQLGSKIHFLVTNIPECTNCERYNKNRNFSIDQIIAKDQTGLNAKHSFHRNAQDAIDQIKELELSKLGSPLFDCIWSNYLKSQDLQNTSAYEKKVLLIFSDGEDNLLREQPGVKKPSECFFEIKEGEIKHFFNQISFISYQGTGGTRLFDYCSDIHIYDGNDSGSLATALKKELKNFLLDWSLIYSLLGIVLLTSIMIFTSRI